MDGLVYYIKCDNDSDKFRQTAPLQQVSVTGLIRDAVAQYTLVQTYVNPHKDATIEAIYTFPLYEGVAVSGFEAEVDGRRIVGRVREKETAKKEYEVAKKAGKVASLLDQERPDVFQASIGNIPPSKPISIRITLISEIKQDADENQVRFVLPLAIASRYGWNEPEMNVADSTAKFAMDMSCAMSKAITSIQSPSHTIQVHLGGSPTEASSTTDSTFEPNRARVTLTADSLLDRDLVLIIQSQGLDAPRALVERHPSDGTHAISLTFSPRFELNPIQSSELIFVVDRSGSMDGHPIKQAGEALELFLKSIPCEDHYFNIVGFGSDHQALFPKSVEYSEESLKKATRYAQTLEADMGGTEMMSAFQEIFERRRRDVPTQIFLLTDGQIWNVEELGQCIREAADEAEKSNSFVRVLSLGIGDSVSHHLIESVARAGGGYAQLVTEGERMEKKVMNMLKGALMPPVTKAGVQWSAATGAEDIDDVVEQLEDFVMVEGAEADSSPAADPVVAESTDSTDSTTPPINLFSTSPEVPAPPPPALSSPPPEVVIPIHQAPFKFPILSRGSRFTIYAILSATVPIPKELILQGSSPDGPVELKVTIESVQEGETMLHCLAARTLLRDLEEGSSCIHALGKTTTATQEQMLKRLGVHLVQDGKKYKNAPLSAKHVSKITKQAIIDLALRYKLSSKYTSWVAIDEDSHQSVFSEERESSDENAAYDSTCYYSQQQMATPAKGAQSAMCMPRSKCAVQSAPMMCAVGPYTAKAAEVEVEYDEMSFMLETCIDASDSCADLMGQRIGGWSTSSPTQVHHLPPSSAADGAALEEDSSDDELEGQELQSDDPHAKLRSVLQHQSFDGSFPLIPEIAALFSTTVEALGAKLEEICKLSALTIPKAQWEKVWATCLAVAFMKQQLPELQEEWELVVEKAEKRVAKLLTSAQDVAAVKEAAERICSAACAGGDQPCAQEGQGAATISEALETLAVADEHHPATTV